MSRRVALLRGTGFVLAAGLGIVGVWMIVTGGDSKAIRIGAISAFWGLLLGTYAMLGTRGPSQPAPAAPVAPPAPPAPPVVRELDLRQVGEIERSAVAAARREFQQELQLMLRREVTDGFAREVAELRNEVNALRNDLVEKVGGQLRLERIETTRLIGSDLEAVQSELRMLRENGAEVEASAAASLPATIGLPRDTVARQEPSVDGPVDNAAEAAAPEIHDAEIVDETMHEPTTEQPEGAAAEADPGDGAPEPEPERPADPFAGMPRITPFTDFALDPTPAPAKPDNGAGRRHRAEEGGHDVLARILAREQR